MQVSFQNKFEKFVHLVCVIIRIDLSLVYNIQTGSGIPIQWTSGVMLPGHEAVHLNLIKMCGAMSTLCHMDV